MNKTFQNVIDTFETLVLSGNSVLKSFGFGELWEIETKELAYPSLFIDNVTNSHTYQAGQVEFVLDIWIFDLVYDDESNEKYVISDMPQIGFDLINHLQDNEDTYGFWINKPQGTSISFEMYNEMWDDSVSGVKFTVSVIIPDGGDKCKNIFN